MPPRPASARLADILAAIGRIRQHAEGLSPEAFANDRKTLDAVLYNLAVIGEAAASLAPSLQQAFPDLPWAEMRGMRNIVVHEYFGVSPQIRWETLQTDLPLLEHRLQEIVASGRVDQA